MIFEPEGDDKLEGRFFDLSVDMLCIAGFDGFFKRLNKAWEETLGWTREELMVRPYIDFVHPDDREGTLQAAAEHLRGQNVTRFENRYLCKDGSYRWISWTSHPVHEESLVFAVCRDVTGMRETEAALRESEQRYRRLLEVATEGILVIDGDAVITFANERLLGMLDRPAEEVIGRPLPSFIDERDVPLMLGHIGLRKRGVEEDYDIRFVQKDGRRILTNISAAPVFDERRRFAGSVSLITDVTEKRRMERELWEEKERLQVTLRSIGDGVIVTDNEGTVVMLNGVGEELTGWSQEEAVGRPLEEVFNILNEFTRVRCESPVEKVLREGRVVGLANHTVLIARDGTERTLGDSGAPIKDDQGNIIGVVLIFRDMTSERRMEREMTKMQRLESIGVLAGGIAHDFNNYLTAIEGNIALARMGAVADVAATDRLADAEKALVKARGLTKQLLTFSKGGEPVKRPVDLGAVLSDCLNISLAGSNVSCRLTVEPGLWTVEADEGQIGQVFNNLIINAKEAMPDGGLLEVEARNVPADNRTGERRGLVRVTVRDHGVGIPARDLDRIFEPYYTTKYGGRGLGLAIVHSILKHHDGTITASSEVGRGSTFTLLLPTLCVHHEPEGEEGAVPERGNGRLLWMDDEEMIREVAGHLLSFMGYRAAFAKDGREAILLYKEAMASGEPFDLVILDLTIPGGLGGEETMRELLRLDPEVKAIVCSGYSNDPVMSHYYDYGFRGVLSKPFSVADLSTVVSELMPSDRR